MNELRRQLLDDSDAPAQLSPQLRFLASRGAAAAALLLNHAELYKHLLERYQREGASPEIEEIALDAAGNLATVLQSLRSREDLLAMVRISPDVPGIPVAAIDQLAFSFLLLTGPQSEDESLACLAPEWVDAVLEADDVKEWLDSLQAKPLTIGPPDGEA
ncbi:MAG TPA: hypothetical protein VGL51_16075 [Solirubrobacteraceae bacterium]